MHSKTPKGVMCYTRMAMERARSFFFGRGRGGGERERDV